MLFRKWLEIERNDENFGSPGLEKWPNQKFEILWTKFKMADLKNAILETVRYRAKRIEIWDHMGKKSQIL